MWSRRAQEYEGKINSGDITSIAEVVRDLHKNVDDPERSYSERVIYESAFNRLSSELAAVENIESACASERISEVLKDKYAA
jgi:CarD family transcriptional regulator